MANNIDDLRRVVRPFGGVSSSSQGGDPVESDGDDEWPLCPSWQKGWDIVLRGSMVYFVCLLIYFSCF